MNAKQVLSKIATMLSLNTEVQFVDAKTADGTILQSPTFDLGEDVEVVSENVEEEMAAADAEKIKTEPLPGDPTKVNEVEELAGVSEASGPLGANAETDAVGPIPQTADKPEMDMGMLVSKFEELSFRISELEKALESKMAEVEVEINPEEETEDEELPKLDGAPVEANQMFSQQENQKKYGKKEGNYQSTFLSKLYK